MSERVTLVPIFYLEKISCPRHCSSSSEKGLLGCKRCRDGSLSLPTFCGFESISKLFADIFFAISLHVAASLFGSPQFYLKTVQATVPSRKCTAGYAFCQRFLRWSKAAFALIHFFIKRRKVRALSPPLLISRSHVAYVCKRAFSILPTHF